MAASMPTARGAGTQEFFHPPSAILVRATRAGAAASAAAAQGKNSCFAAAANAARGSRRRPPSRVRPAQATTGDDPTHDDRPMTTAPHAVRPAGRATVAAGAGRWPCDVARRADAAAHVVGLGIALAAAPALTAGAGAALGLHAVTPALLFLASGLFHHGPADWRRVAARLDHAAIYAAIAAATGALVAATGGDVGPVVGVLWPLALAGATLRALGPDRMRGASLGLYAAMGAVAATLAWPAVAALSPEAARLALIASGALAVGFVFHLGERLRFGQPVWHGAVALAILAFDAALLVEAQARA
jgi:hemolysin III